MVFSCMCCYFKCYFDIIFCVWGGGNGYYFEKEIILKDILKEFNWLKVRENYYICSSLFVEKIFKVMYKIE